MQSLGSPPPELLRTDLPLAPTFAKPAVVADPKLGGKEPAAEITHRERAGRLYDDRVIACTLLWYETVREVHAMTTAGSELARIEAECVKYINAPAPKQKKKAAPKASTS